MDHSRCLLHVRGSCSRVAFANRREVWFENIQQAMIAATRDLCHSNLVAAWPGKLSTCVEHSPAKYAVSSKSHGKQGSMFAQDSGELILHEAQKWKDSVLEKLQTIRVDIHVSWM